MVVEGKPTKDMFLQLLIAVPTTPNNNKDIIWANYQDGRVIFNNSRAWFDSIVIAMAVMTGLIADNTDGSLYYYNHHLVLPNWSEHRELKTVIGNHTFMK